MKIFLLGLTLLLSNFALADKCQEFLQQLPTDYFTDRVSVPEDWNNPKGKQIEVFYYGKKNPENKRPNIAFFNGGPSASSHGSHTLLESHPESSLVNFIYIDQRGTGCSSRFPTGNSKEIAQRLTHYTSRSIVMDAEAIRKKLLGNNSKWKILGQSYGGLIVHRYIAIAPESIDEAYIHGYAIMTDQVEWIKERILSQKRVIEDYFKLYPDDRNSIEKIKEMIPSDYCFREDGISLCGKNVLDVLRHPLGFRDSWEDMHWWLENLPLFYQEQPSMMEGLSRMYFSDFTHDSLPSLVINKVEVTKGPSDREECIEAFKRLKTSGDNPELWPINECRVLINIQNTTFDEAINSVNHIDPLTLESVKKSLLDNPTLKVYLYAGQKDVFVPIKTFKEEEEKLSGLIHFTDFVDSRHEGFHTEQKIWDDLTQ